MLSQPEKNRSVGDAELLRDFTSASLLENIVLDEPVLLTKDDMLALVLVLLELS